MVVNYVIYHKSCMDGFASLTVLDHFGVFERSGRTWFHAAAPNDKELPPNLSASREVVIADVNYRASMVLDILTTPVKSVLMFDHHISRDTEAFRAMEKSYKNFKYVHDLQDCAAGIVWKHYSRGKEPVPYSIQLIGDSDRGVWSMKDSQNFVLGLDVLYNEKPGLSRELTLKKLELWRSTIFSPEKVAEIIQHGAVVAPFNSMVIEKMSSNYEIVGLRTPQGGTLKLLVTNVGVYMAAKVAIRLSQKTDADLVIAWYYNSKVKRIVCVVRSKSADVSWLLHMYKGGGHPKAGTFFYKAKHVDKFVKRHNEKLSAT